MLEEQIVRRVHQDRRQSVKNVEFSVKGNTLTIVVDLTKEFGPSSSGKAIIIASTEGNFPLPGRSEVVGSQRISEEMTRSDSIRATGC